MRSTHYSEPGAAHGTAACGLHRNRGRRYTTGLHSTSVTRAVDCASCKRTAAYKAAMVPAAAARRPVGAVLRGYGCTVKVLEDHGRQGYTVRWLDGPDAGRRTMVESWQLHERFVEVSS